MYVCRTRRHGTLRTNTKHAADEEMGALTPKALASYECGFIMHCHGVTSVDTLAIVERKVVQCQGQGLRKFDQFVAQIVARKTGWPARTPSSSTARVNKVPEPTDPEGRIGTSNRPLASLGKRLERRFDTQTRWRGRGGPDLADSGRVSGSGSFPSLGPCSRATRRPARAPGRGQRAGRAPSGRTKGPHLPPGPRHATPRSLATARYNGEKINNRKSCQGKRIAAHRRGPSSAHNSGHKGGRGGEGRGRGGFRGDHLGKGRHREGGGRIHGETALPPD